VKFTPEDGQITVRTWNPPGQAGLVVEVKDTGVGIPPEALAKIFEAFEQGDARVTHRFGGLGLGLAIAKAVAEMHGGSISVSSAGVGRGATFQVRLPMARLDLLDGAEVGAVPVSAASRADGRSS
jgi:signal transduction histidine kinase